MDGTQKELFDQALWEALCVVQDGTPGAMRQVTDIVDLALVDSPQLESICAALVEDADRRRRNQRQTVVGQPRRG